MGCGSSSQRVVVAQGPPQDHPQDRNQTSLQQPQESRGSSSTHSLDYLDSGAPDDQIRSQSLQNIYSSGAVVTTQSEIHRNGLPKKNGEKKMECLEQHMQSPNSSLIGLHQPIQRPKLETLIDGDLNKHVTENNMINLVPDNGPSPIKATITPENNRKLKMDSPRLSEEEIITKTKDYIKMLLKETDYSIKKNSDAIVFIRKNIFPKDREKRKRIVDALISCGLARLFFRVMSQFFPLDFMAAEYTAQWTVLKNVLVIFWNGTDISKTLCQKVVENSTHGYVLEMLQDPRLCKKDLDNKSGIYLIKGILGICHNILQLDDNSRSHLREKGAVQTFVRYKEVENAMVQCKSIMCLAYVIDETENDLLNSADGNFKFLTDILADVLLSPDHHSRKYGYSADELSRVINMIAANDTNKQKLVASGILDLYNTMLKVASSKEEQYHATRGLWALAYDKKCRQTIKEDEELLQSLRFLASRSDDDEIRQVAEGALWVIDEKKFHPSATNNEGDELGHIMISYQWGCQQMMMRVRDHLRAAGYKVWMDVDHMAGSILQAMATAVEKSAVVLICFSHKYYESPNCRLEAEYTFKKKKAFIPCRLEYRYEPDDWLGIMIGNKLYFDFSREERYDESLQGLIRELGDRGRAKQLIVPQFVTPLMASPTRHNSPKFPPIEVTVAPETEKWTPKEVKEWVDRNDLTQHTTLFRDYDGPLLIELKYMMRQAPEFYYKTLREHQRLPLVDVLKITKALKTI